MSKNVTAFYDNLAESYRYIFPDWKGSSLRQGQIINQILEAHGYHADKHTLYDCTCGIGTQLFGLASQGWQVHGTDLSPKSIELARQYATEFETHHTPTFDVFDLLQQPKNPTTYDIVISFDNALPHFMNDADLITALTTMKAHLKEDGLMVISIRDYDALRQNPPRSTFPSISDTDDGRYIVFQTWDWANDLSSYKLNIYIVHHQGETITTRSYPSEYRTLQRHELTSALEQVGFKDIMWIMQEESGNYIPIVTAKNH